jgi:hypothetical protein
MLIRNVDDGGRSPYQLYAKAGNLVFKIVGVLQLRFSGECRLGSLYKVEFYVVKQKTRIDF